MPEDDLSRLAGRVDTLVGVVGVMRDWHDRLAPLVTEQAEINRRLLAIAEHVETIVDRIGSLEKTSRLYGAAIAQHRRRIAAFIAATAAFCCLAIAIGIVHMHEDAQITRQVQQSKHAFCGLLSAQLAAPPSTPYGRALAAAATRLRTDFGC